MCGKKPEGYLLRARTNQRQLFSIWLQYPERSIEKDFSFYALGISETLDIPIKLEAIIRLPY